MKEIVKIFFEKIPAEQLIQERTLTWKMLLPKSRENRGLKFLKVILLVFFTFLMLVPLSIIVAITRCAFRNIGKKIVHLIKKSYIYLTTNHLNT